jgi:FkbM family methyltransferase
MKIKNLLPLLGFRGKPQRYTYSVMDYDIGNDITVHYAQWMHPKETTKVISSDLIQGYQQYIGEGDFCIDIGAHSGDTTLPMAVAAGKAGCVLALEPNPYVYHVLQKNSRANTHVGNIITMQAAAAREEGFMEFEYSDAGFCNGGRHEGISSFSHGHAFKLSVFTVDLTNELRSDYSEYLPKLKFIKVDAEGYDLFVLQSLSTIIKEYNPVIKAEVFKKTSARYRADLLSFLSEMGYSVFKIASEPTLPGEELTTNNIDTGKHYDIICLPNKA